MIAVDGYGGAAGKVYLNWQQSQLATRIWPQVHGHEPSPIIAYERRQWTELKGSGFATGATVTHSTDSEVFVIPPERLEFVDSTAIRIFAGVFPADRDAWYVTVTNPGGSESAPYRLNA